MLVYAYGLLFFLGIHVALEAGPARAEDLDAGKSGQQLFAAGCSSCHRTPRGLSKRTNTWSLAYFLRQHYAASQASANELAAYLASVDNVASRGKQKPAAGGQQSILNWLGLSSDNGRNQRKPGNRIEPARDRLAAPPRPMSDIPRPGP